MSEWFSEWFDSKYYHTLYKNRDHQEAEVFLTNLVKHLKLGSEARVLDLACGKGRHSIYLNSLGLDVTGVDLSPNSIALASQWANQTLRFKVHDMRAQIPNPPYDLILNAFTSFGYFNDPSQDLLTLTSIKDGLSTQGLFVMDFLNADYVIPNLVAKETKTIEGIAFNIKRFVKDKSIFKTIEFQDNGKNYQYQERVDALTHSDFLAYFQTVGLELLTTFGDYHLAPFDLKTSKRLILVAKK